MCQKNESSQLTRSEGSQADYFDKRNEKISANSRQVGGAHYRAKIQHWDFAASHNFDYFQGQITKYVTRWKEKGGLQDLLKAQHFLEKYIELESVKPLTPSAIIGSVGAPVGFDHVIQPNMVATWKGWTYEGTKSGVDEYTCKYCKRTVRVDYGLAPGQCECWNARNGGATSAYVNQARDSQASLTPRSRHP